MQVQYSATSPGASQGPVRCEVSESSHGGHGHNNLRNAPKVVNYERELRKLKDQIAATSDKEEKSKLMTRLSEVEHQHRIADSADVSARGPPEACILAPSREPPLGSDCCFFLFLDSSLRAAA